MIGMTEGATIALITTVGAVLVAFITTSAAYLAKQNTRQHGRALAERAVDREATDIDRQETMAHRTHLDDRLNGIHGDVRVVRDALAAHLADHAMHVPAVVVNVGPEATTTTTTPSATVVAEQAA